MPRTLAVARNSSGREFDELLDMMKDYPFTRSPKFVKENFTLTIEGPTVNPVVGQITWLEDLSWRDPPVCNESAPFILAAVITAVENFERRAWVRSTWASPEFYQYTGIKAVFVVGSPNNETLQESLDDEIDKYEDIIQTDFVDTYRNLTYKTISWLSWVKNWCPGTPFIAKIDDDVVVNPFNLRLYLNEYLLRDPSPKRIHGRARFRSKPMRTSKWAVTKEEYPLEHYPPIVLGSAYIVDRNAVDVLLAYVPYVPMLWLEDVFLTGLVAKRAGINLKQAERKLYAWRLTRRFYYGSQAFLLDPKKNEVKQAWQKIVRYSNKSISKLKSGYYNGV
ncbi:beta-1,3-galactosyltransferase 5-like isoform X2 [Portunus trituberculatus]|uniref:beta-1,3-galactosyltransferase 5-like isoform X2 n=1 Tax=Portunus trituberculatus TaxID=210409 RepID=UPI001E1CC34E|nr:beta-1,3-galactosyltransferase 5-like isoform X2 [Portunus trituberculatus]